MVQIGQYCMPKRYMHEFCIAVCQLVLLLHIIVWHVHRQVMKESKGRVNPGLMNKILMQKLKGS